ncbi:hypothetical protein Q1695_004885 [Nippostrongylus brasiliensis]|nr:hypothetical protein Q1695_004885 [Nippostrongylus brasiliensis]
MIGVYDVLDSPVGELLVAEIDGKLAAILFASNSTLSQRFGELFSYYPKITFTKGNVSSAKDISKLLNGEIAENLPISDLVFERCSQFQKAVYEQLLRIPRGSTKSYGEIASLIGRPTAYRGVARACKANVLSIVIPCHRVIASDGSLQGYGGGLDAKRYLLKMERAGCVMKD